MLTVICFSFLKSRFVCIELDFNVEFDGNSERGGYYEQDNFIYNDDKSGFIGHTDGKFANSFIIRGHSTNMWTELCHFLTPPLLYIDLWKERLRRPHRRLRPRKRAPASMKNQIN